MVTSSDGENKVYAILASFIIGRFVAGYAADTFFAVDAMISANIMLIGFIGLLISSNSRK